ncbi:MAG: pantoate--beta-alanine ligase [Flavobacteriales bacterium]
MSIAVFEHINDVQDWVISQRTRGLTIGFVPTMGALHAGHRSLIDLALAHCDCVVASIFVNPTQFNNPDDLLKYPRTLSADLELLELAGCHAVFCPGVEEMYAKDEPTRRWDFGTLTGTLEGYYRPGHFDGVLTIVKKLFLAVTPDKAFFGEKDFQQLANILRMTQLEGLPIEIVAAPTVREASGLAMSSRNMRLNEQERAAALCISRVLFDAAATGRGVSPQQLQSMAESGLLNEPSIKLEYCALVRASDFEPIEAWSAEAAVMLVAAYVGDVRLIDNVIID